MALKQPENGDRSEPSRGADPSLAQAKVLITGANGFVGRALSERLVTSGAEVTGAIRGSESSTVATVGARTVRVGEVDSKTEWMKAVNGIDCVVHLAARVHVRRQVADKAYGEFREVNLAGSTRLAREAAKAGVQRLIYVSTIKVNGEHTTGRPFSSSDALHPVDAYAHSKREAESALAEVGRQTGMEIVIVRPPLVYGPGVKGNFLSMLRIIQADVPLPLASCVNSRSLLGLTNLVDLLVLCIRHPAAAGQIFLAADGEDLSTPELVKRLARALGKRARLFSVPQPLLQVAARLMGKPELYDRLCCSLQVDISQTRRTLGWAPSSSVDTELMRTALWFLEKDLQR